MGQFQQTERDQIAVAAAERRILDLRTQGFRPRQIVAELAAAGGESDLKEVARVLRANAEAIRARNRSLSATRFVRADTILARLIDRWYAQLLKGFDRDVAKALVSFLDRQAKMLGLDASRGTHDNDSWLDDKSDEELLAIVRTQYGLKVPDDILPSRETDETVRSD